MYIVILVYTSDWSLARGGRLSVCFFILGEAHVGPFMKGPLKGADILIPQKVGHVGKGERRVAQILFPRRKRV